MGTKAEMVKSTLKQERVDWKQFTITDFQKVAEERGGRCLSSEFEYANSNSRLLWRCDKCGHEWHSAVFNVKARGTWCAKCALNGYQTETKVYEETRAIFPDTERGFRPSWCLHPETKKCLSFDVVVPSLKCIIEVDGKQHFEKIEMWGSTNPEEVRKRDIIKMTQAHENGYKVVRVLQEDVWRNKRLLSDKIESIVRDPSRIPVFLTDVKNEAVYDNHKRDIIDVLRTSLSSEVFYWAELENYEPLFTEEDMPLIRELIRAKFDEIGETPTEEESLDLQDIEMLLPIKLTEFVTKARLVHGHKYDYSQVVYVNSHTYVTVRCRLHGEFSVTPSHHISTNRACAGCAGNLRLTLEECKRVAELRNGKCLSSEYKNNSTKMLWECSEGHQWEAVIASIKTLNTWCPKCHGTQNLTINDCIEFGEKIGYKCVSTVYVGVKHKLDWICDKGHPYKSSMDSIRNAGSRCRSCSNEKRKTRSQL